MRAQFQVIVFPYRLSAGDGFEYCIFKRRDCGAWQAISGGGEAMETPLETARRESCEEVGICNEEHFTELDSIGQIPVEKIGGRIWGDEVTSVPEHSFGVAFTGTEIQLSEEHTEFMWLSYDLAIEKLTFDTNKVALTELHSRLTSNFPTNK